MAFRALIGAGLFLAWLGLLLPWERWRAEARSPTAIGADGSVGGFDASGWLWIALVVATLLAALALWRRWRWAFAALAVAALVLVVVAVREIAATVAAGSAFVSVVPGAGVILALAGALALIAAVVVALRPPAVQLAAGLTVFALVAGGVAALPQDGGRPDDGAIADAVDDPARAMAFLGDTLYRVAGPELVAQPAPDREYGAVGLWTSEWSPDDLDFDDYAGAGLTFAGDVAYVALGGIDRLIAITADGERRMLAARPPEREEPELPEGTQVVDDFIAGPVAAGPDGSVYVLQGDAVARWRPDGLQTLAPRFDGATDIATDARGGVYVADTGNGRVHRIDLDGGVRTVVGTEAERDCVTRGLDDPLALDPRRCTAVKALAVDRAGNLYMALRNVAMIVGLTPRGRMAVVAGTGPKGFGDGDGRAVQARLGVVDALAVGPDGDLYVSEPERVRRIADPAGILASDPPEPERPEPAAACGEIAALMEASAVGDPDALERALNALADTAPEEIADDVADIAAGATSRTRAEAEIRSAMEPDAFDVSLGEYAEEECGFAGGFDVPVDEANEFCVAYGRYRDQGDLVEAGEEPPRALADVVEAAPAFLAPTGRTALRDLEDAAGRAVPDAEVAGLTAGIEAIATVASSMCAQG